MSLQSSKLNAQNIFHLKDSFERSDLNYSAISNMDYSNYDHLLDSVFNAVRGKFKIYRFVRFSKGISKDNVDPDSTFKELIVLKVKNNIVLEGYYVPLDWREPPISSVLLKSTTRIAFKDFLNTDDLKFVSLYPGGGYRLLSNSILSLE